MDVSSLINQILGFQDLNFISFISCSDFQSLKIYTKAKHQPMGCKSCLYPALHVHSWRKKTVQVPPMGIYKHVLLEIRYERFKCPVCGIVQSQLPKGIHKKFDGFSNSFVES